MNRSDFFAFLKAPFKERFLLACALGLPLLLAAPFIFSFFQFIFGHVDTFLTTSDAEIENLLYNWFITQNTILTISAVSGSFLAFVLVTGFSYVLGHTIVTQRAKTFDFRPVSITGMQVVIGILKTISYFFWGGAYFILVVLAMSALPVLMLSVGHYMPFFIALPLWIVAIGVGIAILIWTVLNTWVSNFRFISTFKTRVFFQLRANYLYLKQYKGRFFVAWALCFVCGMIVQILLRTSYSWIISAGSFLQGLLLGLKVPQPNVVVVLGLLATIAVTVYLTMLQMTFVAKSIVWTEQKDVSPTKTVSQKKTVAHTKTVERKKTVVHKKTVAHKKTVELPHKRK